MKIAVASQGQELESQVDQRFGRAPYFVVVDTDTYDFTCVTNEQNLNAPQGAGIQSGQTVAETGAEAVIAGNVGPKAYQTLQAAGVAIYLAPTSTVKEAVEQCVAGKLQKQKEANVPGHW